MTGTRNAREIERSLQQLRLHMPEMTAERHLRALVREVHEARSAAPAARPLRRRRPRRVHRVAIATGLLLALVLPPAVLAAEGAMPGEFLYPLKRSTEWARSFVDPGVAVRHRLDEAETAVERWSPLPVVIERFSRIPMHLASDPQHAPELERVRARVMERYGVDPVTELGAGETIVSPEPDPTAPPRAPEPGDDPVPGGAGNGQRNREGSGSRAQP